MRLAAVRGMVVASAKCTELTGASFVLCSPLETLDDIRGSDEAADGLFVARDMVGAPEGSTVLVTTGSAARLVADAPVDACVVGILDYAVVGGDRIGGWQKNEDDG